MNKGCRIEDGVLKIGDKGWRAKHERGWRGQGLRDGGTIKRD
jgi:hypothetical protein